jgi:hypothetical protein
MKIPLRLKSSERTYTLEHMMFEFKHPDHEVTIIRWMHGNYIGKYEVLAVEMPNATLVPMCGCGECKRHTFDDFDGAIKHAETLAVLATQHIAEKKCPQPMTSKAVH